MNRLLKYHVIVVFVGIFGCQDCLGRLGCPSGNASKYCYKVVKVNGTCFEKTKCDKYHPMQCVFKREYESKPCIIKRCTDQCCDGYIKNEYSECISEAEIASIRCENGGTKTKFGKCVCSHSFSGTRCQDPICSGPCYNGGRCGVDKGVPKCICPSLLLSGWFCEKYSCVDSCLNGGECVKDGTSSSCKCSHGYQGDRCQFPISENCPFVSIRSQATCGGLWNECESDLDCENRTVDTACCYDGCKGVCRKPTLKTCNFKGNFYKYGKTFSINSCKKCVCHLYGEVTCSTIESSAKRCPGGQKALKVARQCCKVCPGKEITDKEVPRFTDCPERFLVLNVSENDDVAHLPSLNLIAVDAEGKLLKVSYTLTSFNHKHHHEINQNIHIATAYSECDIYGRRAECAFRIIVRDPFPPVFESCDTDIQAVEREVVTWDNPVVTDNVGLYSITVDGGQIKNQVLWSGNYTVSYTASDFDMNKAICSFLVRVSEKDHQEGHYKHDNDHYNYPYSTIVGVGSGLVVIVGLCLCLTFRASKRRDKKRARRQRGQNDDSISSVTDPDVEQNSDVYENIETKPTYLPKYSPPSDPPSYNDIELGISSKVETTQDKEPVSQENENRADNSEENNAFESDSP